MSLAYLWFASMLVMLNLYLQNTDASLLATVGWPAFGIHEEPIRSRTIDKVIRKLKGARGFKRFIRDGFKTVVEDVKRKYYKPAEIKVSL